MCSSTENMSSVLFQQFDADTTRAHILIALKGGRVSVSSEIPELVRPVKLIAQGNLNDEQCSDITDEIVALFVSADGSWIVEDPVQPAFPCDLESFLFSPIQFFKLTMSDDKKSLLERIDQTQAYAEVRVQEAHPGAHDLGFKIGPSLELYSIKDIVVVESLRKNSEGSHIACHVRVNGKDMFCKAERGGIAFGDSGVGCDFKRMLQIRDGIATNTDLALHVPKLLGYIRHPEEGHVVGFLRDWIPGKNLAAHNIEEVPFETRLDWDTKIATTVGQLHEMECIWGGGNPESVVIDEDGEPWLIDFSSGVASGWRDEDSDDPNGDWRGVDDISRFLGLCEDEDEDQGFDCGDRTIGAQATIPISLARF